MIKAAKLCSFVVSALLSCGVFAKAGDVDVSALVKKAEFNLRGTSYQGEALMTVRRGDTNRELRFKFFMLGDSASMIRILEPTKDRGITNLRKEFNLWQFLPKVNRVIRVPSSLMLQSWMGSDFSNDDVVKASSWVRDYTAKLVEPNPVKNPGFATVELSPKKNAPIVWGKVRLVLRESDAAFMKQEFYKENGTLVKTLTATKHVTQNNRVIPLFYSMKNNEDASMQTEISFDAKTIKVDRGISATFFSEAKMRDSSW